MNERLKSYLESCDAATMDPSTLEDLRKAMEEAVPEIAESIRRREQLAAQLRNTGSTPPQSNTDKED